MARNLFTEEDATFKWNPHDFFQKIYSRENLEDFSIVYGLGQHNPKVPFLFQNLTDTTYKSFYEVCGLSSDLGDSNLDERRREAMKEVIEDFVNDNIVKESHKYFCRLDGNQFGSERDVIAHIRSGHKHKIEDMLKFMAEDMEQEYLGNFFTKICYSGIIHTFLSYGEKKDFVYPPTPKTLTQVYPDFPSSIAPDEEEIEFSKYRGEFPPNRTKDSKGSKEVLEAMSAFRKERKTILAKNIFSGEELLEIEKKVFGDKYAPKSTKREDSVQKGESSKPQHSSQKAPNGIPTKSVTVNAPTEPPSVPVKESSISKKKKKKKEAQQQQPIEIVEPEPLEVPEPKKDVPKNNKKNKEPPQVEEPAPEPPKPKTQSSKAKQPPSKNPQAPTKVPEEPKEEEESAPQEPPIKIDKKHKKQLEEEFSNELLDEVVADLCKKLGARTFQEMRKQADKDREAAELKAKEDENIKREAEIAAEKERKVKEKKDRRDERKQEGERLVDEILEEVLKDEIIGVASDVLTELVKAKEAAIKQAMPPSPAWAVPLTRPVLGGAVPIPIMIPPAYLVPNMMNRQMMPTMNVQNMNVNPPVKEQKMQPPNKQVRVNPNQPANQPSQQFKSRILPNSNPVQTTDIKTPNQTVSPAPNLSGISTSNPFLSDASNAFSSNLFSKPTPLDSNMYPVHSPEPQTETSNKQSIPLNASRDDIINEAINFDRMDGDFEFDEETEESQSKSQQSVLSYQFLSPSTNIFGSAFSNFPNSQSSQFAPPMQQRPPSKNTGSAPQSKPIMNLPPGSRSLTDSYGSFSPASPSVAVRSLPEDWGYDPKLTVVVKGIPPELSRKSDIMSFFKDIQIPLGPDFSTKIQFLKGSDTGCCFVEFQNAIDVDRALEKSGSRLGNSILEVERTKVTLTSETGQRYTLSTNTRNVAIPGMSNAEKIPGLKAEAPEFHPQAPSAKSVSPTPPSLLSTLVDTQNDTIIPIDKHKRHTGQAIGSATKTNTQVPSLQQLAANSVPTVTNPFFSQDNSSSVFNTSLFSGPISIDHLNNASSYGLFGNSIQINQELDQNEEENEIEDRTQFQNQEKDAEDAFMDRFG